MNLKTVISPSDSEYNTGRLSEILTEISGFKTPSGKKWLFNYQKLVEFPFLKIDDFSDDEIRSEFNDILDVFTPIVDSVEKKFIEYESELLDLKNCL